MAFLPMDIMYHEVKLRHGAYNCPEGGISSVAIAELKQGTGIVKRGVARIIR